MKKKIERKLVLNKETLRTLGGDQLKKVVGGIPPQTETSCDDHCETEDDG